MTRPTAEERALLIEQAAGAYRAVDPLRGTLLPDPAFHDLDGDGREEAFALALGLRPLEAALDPDGLSTTVRAVLARIQQAR
jgi:hypothetical protein